MSALPPGSTIGIIGGGQLGRMSAMAAARLGYRTHIYTPEQGCPAGQVASCVTVAGYDDEKALRAFATSVDVITFEFENISAVSLDLLEGLKPVRPSPAILRISQDRGLEKDFLRQIGVPTAQWALVESRDDLQKAVEAVGLPAILKTTRLGYDGKGQRTLNDAADLDRAWEDLNPKPLILEQKIDFASECSVAVARGVDGDIALFDVAENHHKNHILDLTLAPARLSAEAADQAMAIGRTVAEKLDLVGLIVVELFVDRNGQILANEIAPRPHNSFHWTLDACAQDQFDLHIRAVAGLKLPSTARHSDAVMKNLIGPSDMALWSAILTDRALIPHAYGKDEAREGRKMGHVTRLFPFGALPGDLGVSAAIGVCQTKPGA
jgi:5-(carboxyamino)imidazole ribonucleotide synthase